MSEEPAVTPRSTSFDKHDASRQEDAPPQRPAPLALSALSHTDMVVHPAGPAASLLRGSPRPRSTGQSPRDSVGSAEAASPSSTSSGRSPSTGPSPRNRARRSSTRYTRPPVGTLSNYAKKNNIEGARRILAAKEADVDEKDGSSATPLIHCVWDNNIEIVRMLLQCGADVNAATLRGFCALHFAFERGHKDLIELLFVEYGADHTLKNSLGRTPPECAYLVEERPLPPPTEEHHVEARADAEYRAMRRRSMAKLAALNGSSAGRGARSEVAAITPPSSPTREGDAAAAEDGGEIALRDGQHVAASDAARPALNLNIDSAETAMLTQLEIFVLARERYLGALAAKQLMLATEVRKWDESGGRAPAGSISLRGSTKRPGVYAPAGLVAKVQEQWQRKISKARAQRRRVLVLMPWVEFADSHHKPYFYNRATKALTWDAPEGFITHELRVNSNRDQVRLSNDEFEGKPWHAEIRGADEWLSPDMMEEVDSLEAFVVAELHRLLWLICRAQSVDLSHGGFDPSHAVLLEAQKNAVISAAVKTFALNAAAKMCLALTAALVTAVEASQVEATARRELSMKHPELPFNPAHCVNTPSLRRIARCIPTKVMLREDMVSAETWASRMKHIVPGIEGLGLLASILQEAIMTIAATQLNGETINVTDLLADEFAAAVMAAPFLPDAGKALMGALQPEISKQQKKMTAALTSLRSNKRELKELLKAKAKQDAKLCDALGMLPPKKVADTAPRRRGRDVPNMKLGLPPRAGNLVAPASAEMLLRVREMHQRSITGKRL